MDPTGDNSDSKKSSGKKDLDNNEKSMNQGNDGKGFKIDGKEDDPEKKKKNCAC